MAAARTKKAKKAATAAAATTSPWVQRLVEDEDLRDNFRVAFEAAKDAYERVSPTARARKALVEDKKLQKDLKQGRRRARRTPAPRSSEGPKKKQEEAPRPQAAVLVVGAGDRARAERGPAHEGARRAVRQGGGVRVHLHHDAEHAAAGAAYAGAPRRSRRGARGRPPCAAAVGAPARRRWLTASYDRCDVRHRHDRPPTRRRRAGPHARERQGQAHRRRDARERRRTRRGRLDVRPRRARGRRLARPAALLLRHEGAAARRGRAARLRDPHRRPRGRSCSGAHTADDFIDGARARARRSWSSATPTSSC